MFCWLGIHRWKVFGMHKSRDISFGKPGILHTCVLSICKTCDKQKSYYIDGDWTEAFYEKLKEGREYV